MFSSTIQVSVFVFVTALIGFLTYLSCRGQNRNSQSQNRELFLAGGGLAWYFIAGSITLTNLSTCLLYTSPSPRDS